MRDNVVSISTELDNSGIEKGAREIKGDLGGVEGVVNDVRDALKAAFSGDFDKSVANAHARVNELKRRLESVSSDLKYAIADGDDAAAEKYGEQRIRIYDQLEAARERLANAVRSAAQKEAEAEEREAQRAAKAAEKEADAKIKAAERAAAAKKRAEEKQYKAATKSVRRFGNRFREIVSGALVFNVLSAGLREMTSYFGTALKANKEFTKSFAQLKGALLTAFQPIYEAVLPALIALMRVLTAVVQAVGQFFAAISGKFYNQMVANAEALNKEAAAIDGVGSSAKKAQKQLAGFDEINKLNSEDNSSGGGSGSTKPDFETVAITDSLEHILYLVGAIGAALLTWRIASMFTSSLSIILGLALAVGGAVLFVFNVFDAFQNGIDWKNLSGMLLGMIALAGGLYLAFGAVAGAIGLLIAGVLMVIVAVQEWIKTGELSNEACVTLVGGILAIGAAISLLTGSWIPLLIGAIAAFVVAAVTKTEEFKNILAKVNDWLQNVFQKDWTEVFGTGLGTQLNVFFAFCSGIWTAVTEILSGVIDFIAGVFTGDWERAWTGVKNIFKGIVNGIIGFVNGMIRAVVSGINAVIRALNKISVTIPDWVPGLGGEKFGLNLSEIKAPQIPLLAQGAVLPPNKPFMAVVGDQRHGTNIEAPLSTIQEAVALVMQDQTSAILAGFETSVGVQREILEAVLGIQIGDDVIGNAVARYSRKQAVMRGGAL